MITMHEFTAVRSDGWDLKVKPRSLEAALAVLRELPEFSALVAECDQVIAAHTPHALSWGCRAACYAAAIVELLPGYWLGIERPVLERMVAAELAQARRHLGVLEEWRSAMAAYGVAEPPELERTLGGARDRVAALDAAEASL